MDLPSLVPVDDVGVITGTGIALATLIFAALLQLPLARMIATLSAQTSHRLRQAILDACLNASPGYRHKLQEGYITQLVGQYSQRAEGTVGQLLLFLASSASLLSIVVIAVILNPLVMAAATVSLAFLSLAFRPRGSTYACRHPYGNSSPRAGRRGRPAPSLRESSWVHPRTE